jgi:DNA helicase IV
MVLRLPRYAELSEDEQIPIYNLPLDNNYLIKGPPGTGKTILALYRAARLKKMEVNGCSPQVMFLVFNKPLRKYLEQAIEEVGLDNAYVNNWHRWYHNTFLTWYNQHFTQIKYNNNPEWEPILSNLKKIPDAQLPNHWDHLILDEAQDLPAGLLHVLKRMASNVTIFADPRQRIHENANHGIIADILNIFSIDSKTFYLTRNFRNTKQIYDVAWLFYTGDVADLPAHPRKIGTKPRLVKTRSLDETAHFIANLGENNTGQNLGVLLPPNKLLDQYEESITKYTQRVHVQKYNTRKDDQFDFERDGIKIMSFNVMKGLEFDTVVIPELGYYSDTERSRNIIYVAATRPSTNLIFIKTDKDQNTFVVNELRSHPELIDQQEFKLSSASNIPF